MRKLLFTAALVASLLIGNLVAYATPAGATGFTKVTQPFSVDEATPGTTIPRGSTVRHLSDGTTVVTGPDDSLVLDARDSDASVVKTPSGPLKATYVFSVPSGADVEANGNVTTVTKDGQTILRVVEDNRQNRTWPGTDYWLEQSNNWNISNLDYYTADWSVPSSPPSPGSSVTDYLFNAIEPQSGGAILQPVLEWNVGGSGRWTGAAWYGVGGSYYHSTRIDVSVSDSLIGAMDRYGSSWEINFQDNTSSQTTGLSTSSVGTSSLAVFTVLEGWNVTSDNDLPGDTTFSSMSFEYGGNSVSFSWNSHYDYPSGVTGPPSGLDVQINSQSNVTLNTAN